MNTYDIQKGMDVYGNDGEKIGTVDNVPSAGGSSSTDTGSSFQYGPGHHGVFGDEARAANDPGKGGGTGTLGDETRASGGYEATDTGGNEPVGIVEGVVVEEVYSPGSTGMSGGNQYFTVSSGGVLGIGAKTLYIPVSAVQTVDDNGVTLNITKDEAENLYSTKPATANI